MSRQKGGRLFRTLAVLGLLLGHPAAMALSQEPGALAREGLRAELSAHIRCAEPITVRDTVLPYFAGVHFRIGSCLAEHQVTYAVIVGTDSVAVYLLDSPSAFNFLRTRHPPRGLDSRSVLEYTTLALMLRGDVSGLAHRIAEHEVMADSLIDAVNADRHQLPRTTVIAMGHQLYEVAFAIIDRNHISSFRCTVDVGTGGVTATRRWESTAW